MIQRKDKKYKNKKNLIQDLSENEFYLVKLIIALAILRQLKTKLNLLWGIRIVFRYKSKHKKRSWKVHSYWELQLWNKWYSK